MSTGRINGEQLSIGPRRGIQRRPLRAAWITPFAGGSRPRTHRLKRS